MDVDVNNLFNIRVDSKMNKSDLLHFLKKLKIYIYIKDNLTWPFENWLFIVL